VYNSRTGLTPDLIQSISVQPSAILPALDHLELI
jgi:hypothetical protein